MNRLANWLSELGLYPDSVHRLLFFAVLNDSQMALALYDLEASGGAICPTIEIAENVLDFILSEVIGASLVIPHVEVVTQLGHLLRCKPQLGQIVPAIASEVEDSARG